ncbi:MAG: transposase [Nitrososphaerales archaeon]
MGYDAHKKIKGTKVHVIAAKESIPLAIAIGPGDQHEGKELITLMEAIRIEHHKGKKGRPRRRPKRVYADNKYGTHINRIYLDAKRISSHIPSRAKKKHQGRPRTIDNVSYKKVRSMIERSFGWMKNFRKITIRYERMAITLLGLIHLAPITILWRVLK